MVKERRILVLSFHYPPDLSAGAFRTASLLQAFQAGASSPVAIDVITTVPNRYSTYVPDAHDQNECDGCNIFRIPLRSPRKGMLDQGMALAHYWARATAVTRGKHYDLVYATSSKPMTATLGAYISKRANIPLYLDIRDIFVDTIQDVLEPHLAMVLRPVFSQVERWTINQASRVNLVSRGFEGYFAPRYPNQSFSYFSNGVDDEFLNVAADGTSAERKNGRITVLYAGNIGEGQGLHGIIPPLAQQLRDKVDFRVIGDGGRRALLERELSRVGAQNVVLLDPMKRRDLIREYRAADVLFLHLNDYPAFERSLPSKIFEYAALGKPIWAGVSGYAAEFVRDEIGNARVFSPCNAEQAVSVFGELELRETPRDAFVRKFSRQSIMRDLAADILKLLPG